MVFEYLNTLDMKKARQVSKLWNELLSSSKFTKNEILNIEKCFIAENCEPMKSLMKSTKEFHQIKLGFGIKYSSKEELFTLFAALGRKCKTLILSACEAGYDHTIFKYFANIEYLVAPNCNLNFVYKDFENFPPQKLKEISFMSMVPLSDEELKVFGNIVINTKEYSTISQRLFAGYCLFRFPVRQKGADFKVKNLPTGSGYDEFEVNFTKYLISKNCYKDFF